MKYTQKAQKRAKTEDRSAKAWIGYCAILTLILSAQSGFAQVRGEAESLQRTALSPRITAELNHELSLSRQGQGGQQNVRVIVQYNHALKKETLARLQNKGGQLAGKLDLVQGAAFTVPVNALTSLENDPEVAYVSVDHPVKGMDEYTNAAMNVGPVWSAGYTGTGIGIAVIDSGVDDQHIDIWDRVVYHQDFTGTTQYNAQGELVYDTYGHGTHVGGIIAGSGWVSGGLYPGVANNANLIDLRVLDGNGNGTDSNVIAALQQAIKLKSKYNIRVINLSLGRGVFLPYAQDPLDQAVEAAWKAGIVVVAAAGNYGRVSVNGSNGYGTIAAPGNDPFVLTVGAMKTEETLTRTDDLIASYSSKGPTTYDHVVKPDLVAPGNEVVSLASAGSTLSSTYAGNMIPGLSNDYFMLEHGDSRSFRRGRAADSGESFHDSRPGQGPAHEDRLQNLPGLQRGDRSHDRDHLHRLLRHLHHRSRLPRLAGRLGRQDAGPFECRGSHVPVGRDQREVLLRRAYQRKFGSRQQFRSLGNVGGLGHVGRLGDERGWQLRGLGHFRSLGHGRRQRLRRDLEHDQHLRQQRGVGNGRDQHRRGVCADRRRKVTRRPRSCAQN